jgi:predicted dehydrogenase/glycosyltransferase involved in cell wall biosynthesis
MLTLATELAARFEIILACGDSEACRDLLSRAARRGLAAKAIDPADEAATSGWLSRVDADLLHIHAGIGWEGHGLARIARAVGMRSVRTEHLPYLLTDPAQIAEHRQGLALVERVIIVSGAAADSFRRAGVDEAILATARNGIRPEHPRRPRNETREELGLAQADALVLTVARLTAQKGHRTLIEAMPTILQEHPSTSFAWVGTGPERETLSAELIARDLAGKVCFLGRRSDVADLLEGADLFVLPSEFEGLPLALLEAMAAGLPIVATRIGGIVETLGSDYPFLVPPSDPQALSAAVNALLSDKPLAADQGKAAAERFDTEFHAERMAADTCAVYEAVGVVENVKSRSPRTMIKSRIGFIGAGGIAQRHLGVLETFEDVAVTALADVEFDRAQAAAQRFGARAFESFRDMLDADEFEAIYVCVPPFAHGEIEEELIARGLPFFVEKPLSLDLETAEDIASHVAAKGLVTAVGYHWRYLDTVEEARRILAANPAQLVSGYWLDMTPPPRWWWKADRSGGQMVEQTTHIIDLARYLVGDVTEVFGLSGHKARNDYPGLDVPTVSTASLRFASGAVGNIASTCLLRWGHRIGLHIFGEALAIELSDQDIMVDVGAGRPSRRSQGDPVWSEDRDFINAIRSGENRIRCSYREALKTHRVAHAASRSAKTGQPVSLSSYEP